MFIDIINFPDKTNILKANKKHDNIIILEQVYFSGAIGSDYYDTITVRKITNSIFWRLHNKPSTKIENKKPFLIVVQPFGDFNDAATDYVFKKIKEIYPNIIINKHIQLPTIAYYKPRNRYKADSIISYLKSKANDETIFLGLTNKDISTKKGEVEDFGIMGLGYCPGKSCVASTYRLNKNNLLNQLYKVSIHELGHTQGLPHCKEDKCYMQDAQGKNKTDNLTIFCLQCKNHLIKKGFKF